MACAYLVGEHVVERRCATDDRGEQQDPKAESEVVHGLNGDNLTEDQPGIPFVGTKTIHSRSTSNGERAYLEKREWKPSDFLCFLLPGSSYVCLFLKSAEQQMLDKNK